MVRKMGELVTDALVFRGRMRWLCEKVRSLPCGGEGIGGRERTAGAIDNWISMDPEDVIAASRIPPPAYAVLDKDAGFRTALSVIVGETRFFLCDDCSYPLILEDREEGCPICGDCWSERKPVVIPEKLGK